MPIAFVNNQPVEFGPDERLNCIQAAKKVGFEIPHYCWHPALSVVASCRMCLVEVGEKKPDGSVVMRPKLEPGCQTVLKDGMVVVADSPKVKAAQQATLEYLLLNHPLDCPTCDQAGECWLQDYSFKYGRGFSRLQEPKNLKPDKDHIGDQISIEAIIPTRGLIGFETDLVNQTKGMGVMSHLFHEYGADRGEIPARKNGSLVSMEAGEATAYALNMVQERGRLMVEPGEQIYEGMIVGENARENDIPVNPCRAKRLTNMRSQGDGKGIQLEPPLKLSLERALEYIGPDEYVEATPKHLRLRKKILDETQRKRASATRVIKVHEEVAA